jgi:aspartyl-tRNA(Asn)/glutamyl-tRNA(Gln) amidotransferase subunit C
MAAYEPAFSLRLREDAVTEPNRRDDYQQVAPATQDGLYLVPKSHRISPGLKPR